MSPDRRHKEFFVLCLAPSTESPAYWRANRSLPLPPFSDHMRHHRQFLATGAALLLVGSAASAKAQADAAKSKKPDLPLSVGRHVSFTTSKGSWLSLDVSPDGTTLVFDLL